MVTKNPNSAAEQNCPDLGGSLFVFYFNNEIRGFFTTGRFNIAEVNSMLQSC